MQGFWSGFEKRAVTVRRAGSGPIPGAGNIAEEITKIVSGEGGDIAKALMDSGRALLGPEIMENLSAVAGDPKLTPGYAEAMASLKSLGITTELKHTTPQELQKILMDRARNKVTSSRALSGMNKTMKWLAGFSGVMGGAQLGAAPGLLLRSRFEDKFKDKRDRTLSDHLLAKSPVIGAVAGSALMGIRGYRGGGFLPRVEGLIAKGTKALSKQAELKDSVNLKTHQHDFVQKLLDNDGSLLAAHATGTGKTLTGIAGFEKLKELGKAKRAIVVVPASLRENFVSNLNSYTNSPYAVYGPRGERSSKDIGDKSNADYNLISYELFREHGDKLIEDTGADTLILDEIHRVRGTEGSTYNRLRELRQKFKNAITLTGSVVNNEPNEVVPLLDVTHTPTGHKLVSKPFFDKLFVRKDAVTRGIIHPKVYVEKNIKNKDQLGKYLKGKIHFVSHEALEKDMPKRIVKDEVVYMTKEQQKLYNYSLSAVDPLTRWKIKNNLPVTQREAKDAFSQLMQARQVSTDPSVLDKRLIGQDPYDYSPKVKKVVDDLQEHLAEKPGNKSVIFGNLIRGQLDVVEKALTNKGIPYAKFFGMGQEGMTSKSRPKEIEDFKDGKKRVLLISGAGAEGIDLKNTSMLQMLEGHYNPERIQQAEARIRRLGSFAHLPEEDRKILIKRYMASPTPSKLSKIYGVFGASGGDTGVDKWVYSIAQRKDKLNSDFRTTLEKAPTEKTADDGTYHSRRTKEREVDDAFYELQDTVTKNLAGDLGSTYSHMVGHVAGSLIGAWPQKFLERRRTADVEKKLKQVLLDKGKESLINKRHYPKILAESKIDERMIDAELGMGNLALGMPLLALGSPNFRKFVNKPSALAVKGLSKLPIFGSKGNAVMKLVTSEPIALDVAASALTGFGTGVLFGPSVEYGKTKLLQWALSGRTQDLDKGIKIYEDKLRKKMERKYKGSKSFVQEVDTKKELGLDILD